jgi:hypothetical protein
MSRNGFCFLELEGQHDHAITRQNHLVPGSRANRHYCQTGGASSALGLLDGIV